MCRAAGLQMVRKHGYVLVANSMEDPREVDEAVGQTGPASGGVSPDSLAGFRLRANNGSRIYHRPDPAPSHQKAPVAQITAQIRAFWGGCCWLCMLGRPPPLDFELMFIKPSPTCCREGPPGASAKPTSTAACRAAGHRGNRRNWSSDVPLAHAPLASLRPCCTKVWTRTSEFDTKFGPGWANVSQRWPSLTGIGHVSADFDEIQPDSAKFGYVLPKSIKIGRNCLKFGNQSVARLGPSWGNSAQCRPWLTSMRPNSVRVQLRLAKFD